MVIYSILNDNRELLERFANFQQSYLDVKKYLPFFSIELRGAIQICCRGQWYKFEYYEDPIIRFEKSVHGALFLVVRFNAIDLATGELIEKGINNYYPFDLIETIVVE